MNRFEAFWSLGLHAALGGSVVLAVGAGALLAVRAPAHRARLVLFTALACLAVPLLGAVPGRPRWSVAIGPSRPVGLPTARVSGPASSGPAPGPLALDRPVVERTRPDLAASSDSGGGSQAVTPQLAGPVGLVDPRWLVVLVWASGVVGLMGWWGLGVLSLVRVVRAAGPAPPHLVERFRSLVGAAGDSTRLLVSGRIALPVTFTVARPTILVPEGLAAGGAEADLALLHEWSHVERGDFRHWTLVSLAATLWWFCPLGWLLRRELRLSQDLLADDRAARVGSPVDLAAMLVRMARAQREPSRRLVPLPALGIHAGRSHLARRVAILVANRPPLLTRCRPVWTGSAVALLSLAALLASGLRLDAAPQDPPRPAPAEAPKPKPAPGGREWSGTVVDAKTGRPIAGARVRVALETNKNPRSVRFEPTREVSSVTAADGSFRFALADVEQRDSTLWVNLNVDHPDYMGFGMGYAFAPILKGFGLGQRPPFDRLALEPGTIVSGRAQRPDGRPAAGVPVTAFSTADDSGFDLNRGKWTNARTDDSGRFRLALYPTGPAAVWLLPADDAPQLIPLNDNQRGDLGALQLAAGIRVDGRVLDEAGRPVGGVYVAATQTTEGGGPMPGVPFGVANPIQRTGVTAPDGTFALGPLPPGLVEVAPTPFGNDPGTADSGQRPDRALPGVFVRQKATLEVGREPSPVTFQAVPTVTIRAQMIDSKGRKLGAYETTLWGMMGDTYWFENFAAATDGAITLRGPRGLQRASFDLMNDRRTATAWRLAPGDPLRWSRRVQLGTLDGDRSGIEIVSFEAPVIVVRAVGEAGQAILRPKVTVNYTAPKQIGDDTGFILSPGHQSDVLLDGPQADGRVRTEQLQPDHEVEVIVEAPGFAPTSHKLTLPEGSTEELTLTLRPK